MSDLVRPPFPVRFRRRLTIAFIAVAGISAGGLAIGAAVTVYSHRTSNFEERARQQVQGDLRLIAAGAPPLVVAGRLADAAQPGGPAVIVVLDGEVISSVETLDLSDVPADIREQAQDDAGALIEGRTVLRSGAALVIGTVDADTNTEAYYFFPREELERSLRELLVTLAIGWVLIVVAAGVAGTLMARRTLRPVRTAADAARSVAEGLLDTRLQVGSSDEFGEWAASFNEMVAALEQKIEALAVARDREQRFAADVAHDLRTPIAAILTSASHLAAQRHLAPETKEGVGIVLDAARRLDRLTAELLELHRLEAGQAVLHREPIDIEAAVRHAVLAHGWSEDVVIHSTGTVVADTDRRRLDRILVNLLGNAMTHGGGCVTVTIGREVGGVWVHVNDAGPGIPSDELERIFDRHYKVSAHRGNAGQGSGLGLSIAQESAELLGGRIVASAIEHAGSTFSLWLPDRSPEPAPAAS